MATTLTEFFDRIAFDLHETPSSDDLGLFSSGLFNIVEMVEYLNQAERDFLRETGISKSDVSSILAPASPSLVSKPAGTIDVERVSFDSRRVRRVSALDLERGNPDWRNQSPGPPRRYHEDRLGPGEFEFDRLPAAGGVLRIFADTLPTEHATDPVNLTELVGVPDTWEQYVRFRVLALALGKDGDNQDLPKSQYCQSRYQTGVKLALHLIFGRMMDARP